MDKPLVCERSGKAFLCVFWEHSSFLVFSGNHASVCLWIPGEWHYKWPRVSLIGPQLSWCLSKDEAITRFTHVWKLCYKICLLLKEILRNTVILCMKNSCHFLHFHKHALVLSIRSCLGEHLVEFSRVQLHYHRRETSSHSRVLDLWLFSGFPSAVVVSEPQV